MDPRASADVDTYIAAFPPETRKLLEQMRKTIRDIAPDAEEVMGYGIPTYKLHGKNLVHFAGFKSHIGFYPAPSGIAAFKKELKEYKQAKGSVQFPLDEPLPLATVKKIVWFRVKENAAPTKKK